MFRNNSDKYIRVYTECIKSYCDYYNFGNKSAIYTMNKAYRENALKIEGEYYNGKI